MIFPKVCFLKCFKRSLARRISMHRKCRVSPYIPLIELQHQFVEFRGKVGKSKLTIQRSIDKLEVLKRR